MNEPKQSKIEQLNLRAKQYQEAGMDRFGAIAQAAADLKLNTLVEGDDCRIYEAQDGIFVNCWIGEERSNQEMDYQAIDNSIQWYTSKAYNEVLAV